MRHAGWGVLVLVALAGCAHDDDATVSREQLFRCSAEGLSTSEELAAAAPGTPFKLAGRVAPSVDWCPDLGACGRGEGTCLADTLLVTGLQRLPLRWGSIAPSFCELDACGTASCWPFEGGLRDYWIWGTRDERGALLASGYCLATEPAALVGRYEGTVVVNHADGWQQPHLALTIARAGDALTASFDDLGGCTNCQGWLDPHPATDLRVGDGTLGLTLELIYRDLHRVPLELASSGDCLAAATVVPWPTGDLDVSVRLCRVDR